MSFNSTHSFNTIHAAKFGVNQAILIHHFQFWIEFNRNRNKHHHDHRTWSYGTPEEIAKHFPYFTESQVKYSIKKLIKDGVLISGNYNKKKFDRTNWYAFKDEELYLSPIGQIYPMDETNLTDGSDKDIRPIPDSKTDSQTDVCSDLPGVNAVKDNEFVEYYDVSGKQQLIAKSKIRDHLKGIDPIVIEEIIQQLDEKPRKLSNIIQYCLKIAEKKNKQRKDHELYSSRKDRKGRDSTKKRAKIMEPNPNAPPRKTMAEWSAERGEPFPYM